MSAEEGGPCPEAAPSTDPRRQQYTVDATAVDTPAGIVLTVLPVVPEAAPAAVREGLARRRLAVLTGRCPCGATWTPPNRAERRAAERAGRLLHISVEHEPGCPAADEFLVPRLRGWSS